QDGSLALACDRVSDTAQWLRLQADGAAVPLSSLPRLAPSTTSSAATVHATRLSTRSAAAIAVAPPAPIAARTMPASSLSGRYWQPPNGSAAATPSLAAVVCDARRAVGFVEVPAPPASAAA
ncbi:hypothetical protein HK405_013605, partial [Cladochytrium tenue]